MPRPTCPGSRSPLAYPDVSFHRRAFQPRALSGRGLQLQVFQGGHFYQTRKSTASNTRPNRVCGLRNRKTPSAPGYLDQRHKACLFPVTQQTSRDAVTGKRIHLHRGGGGQYPRTMDRGGDIRWPEIRRACDGLCAVDSKTPAQNPGPASCLQTCNAIVRT